MRRHFFAAVVALVLSDTGGIKLKDHLAILWTVYIASLKRSRCIFMSDTMTTGQPVGHESVGRRCKSGIEQLGYDEGKHTR